MTDIGEKIEYIQFYGDDAVYYEDGTIVPNKVWCNGVVCDKCWGMNPLEEGAEIEFHEYQEEMKGDVKVYYKNGGVAKNRYWFGGNIVDEFYTRVQLPEPKDKTKFEFYMQYLRNKKIEKDRVEALWGDLGFD